MRKLDAVVLAGADNTGPLKASSQSPYEALIEVGGKPMMHYVIEALRGSQYIERIIVVGPKKELEAALAGLEAEIVQCGTGMIDNIKLGIQAVEPGRKVLLATSDIPLLTSDAVDDFLLACEKRQAEVYYPVVSKADNEAKYPGVRRTYFRLREGVYTGGNLVLIEPEVVSRCYDLIGKAVTMRKKPWQLARLLGFRFIVKFLTFGLSLAEIEQRVQEAFGIKGAGIICHRPEIGVDVDKPSDLELVRSILGNGTPPGTQSPSSQPSVG